MIIIIFFILGLVIGSFLNSVVYRINLAESFWERSHCPKCKNKISWYDNIPILSFIILASKCRSCHEKISWQYPIIEILTGILYAFIGLIFFNPFEISAWIYSAFLLLFVSSMIVVFVYDLKYMEIPMSVIWVAIFVTIAYFLYSSWIQYYSGIDSYFSLDIVAGLIGGGVAAIFFALLSVASREKWMGMGDAYLAFLLGMFMGWPQILIALMLSFVIGSVVGMILMLFGKKNMKSQIPFAPFMIIGTAIAFILYEFYPLWTNSIFNI